MVASLLELAGPDWSVPDFSTLSRRQKGLNVAIAIAIAIAIACRQSTGALHLLIDSTGIKAEGKGAWFARKHGPSKPRQWRKVHLGIDADTLEIRAIEITGSRVGEAPMLPERLKQIPADQPIGKGSADGAYDTRGACAVIAGRGACAVIAGRGACAVIAGRGACAVIPARKTARPWLENTPGAQASNETVRATRRLGRTIWRCWSGYHRRSLLETKMRCFKLLGERVMARDFDWQIAELQIRAAILNRFTAPGTPQTQRVA